MTTKMVLHDTRQCRKTEHYTLNSFPDEILIEILSRLPIKVAVTTSVLSHRWHHLWTYVTRLQLTTILKYGSDSTSMLARIFHKLNQSTSGRHNLEKILITAAFDRFLSDDLFFVPSSLFNSQSLVNLDLNGKLKMEFFRNAVIYLPNLRRLKLSSLVHVPDWLESGTLFRCCLLLEDLVLEFKVLELSNPFAVLNIFVPNLKSLVLRIAMESDYDSSEDPLLKIFIDTPKLESLDVNDCGMVYFSFVRNPTNLVSACFDLTMWMDNDDDDDNEAFVAYKTEYLQNMSIFVGQTSTSVTRLKLTLTHTHANILPHFKNGDRWLIPIFDNLIVFEVVTSNETGFDQWCKGFLPLLERFPNLQQIKVKMVGHMYPTMQSVWVGPKFVPVYLKSKLKTIEVWRLKE